MSPPSGRYLKHYSADKLLTHFILTICHGTSWWTVSIKWPVVQMCLKVNFDLLIHLLIHFRTGTCNALLTSMSVVNLDMLQLVHTSSHRLTLGAKVTFMVTTLVYKLREMCQPSYLAKLISNYVPKRALWSLSKTRNRTIYFRFKIDRRSFQYVGTTTVKNISDAIRTIGSFRKHIKSFLFTQ